MFNIDNAQQFTTNQTLTTDYKRLALILKHFKPQPYTTFEDMLADLAGLMRIYITDKTIAYNKLHPTRPKESVTISRKEAVAIMCTIFDIRLLQLTKKDVDQDEMPIGVYMPVGPHQGLYSTTAITIIRNSLFSTDDIDARTTPKSFMSTVRTFLFEQRFVVKLSDSATKTIVNNGIYNHETNQLEPFSPDYVALTKIETNYNANAHNVIIQSPKMNWDLISWIRGLAGETANQYDPDTNTLLWQIIRSAVNPAGIHQKVLMFYAESGNNGKGSYGQLLKNIVGENNYTSVSLPDFGTDFGLEPLLDSHLNIADENPVDAYFPDLSLLKAITTGDDVNINRKNRPIISTRLRFTNIQMINSLPKTKDKTQSFYRRCLIIRFLTSFTNNGEFAAIKQDYLNRTEVKEFALKKALEMPIFNDFIIPQRSLESLSDYQEANDPVVEFWNEFSEQFVWDAVPSTFAYELFCAWFERNNPRQIPLKRNTFLKSTEQWMSDITHGWLYKAGRVSPITIGDKMDNDEPLITEYNLTNYMDTTYKGSDPQKQRNFTRPKSTMRGFQRMTNNNKTP